MPTSAPRATAVLTVLVAALLVVAACSSTGDESADPGGSGGSAGTAAPAPTGTGTTTPAAVERPNIVVIMTDDQTVEQLRVMGRTTELLGEGGTTFERSFVAYSECCPSRATFLTGQHHANHGVLSSSLPFGGVTKLDATDTLPVWLDDAGYWTSFTGKYLNGYGEDAPPDVPPGWDSWWGLVDPTTYQAYEYTVDQDGELRTYGARPEDHTTDVMGAHVVDEIRHRADEPEPFFIWFNPVAPHGLRQDLAGGYTVPRPTPRNKGTLGDEPAPSGPAVTETDLSDKPAFLVERAEVGSTAPASWYRRALESLVDVDEWVGAIEEVLVETDQLDDTIIIFTSDNGFMYGEHGIPTGKLVHYEPSTRVPLLVAGPGIPRGEVRDQLVSNVDLAPTIAELAGVDPGLVVDGRSWLPVLRDPDAGQGRYLLLQSGPHRGRRTFDAIRGERYKLVRHSTGERELYDLVTDPDELESRHDDPALADVAADLERRLDVLVGCAGESCWMQGSPEQPDD